MLIFLLGAVSVCFLTQGSHAASDPGLACTQVASSNRVDTTDRLAQLRAKMGDQLFDAYIVPTEDSHQSEYVSLYDKRREFISGFSGSAGVAVILLNKAALWTDGRYFLQAADELDCNWILMKQGLPGVPSLSDWIIAELKLNSNSSVAADPDLLSAATWIDYKGKFESAGLTFAQGSGLVDAVWDASADPRPKPSNNPVFILEQKFSGIGWQDKLKDVQAQMTTKADILVVTELSEVAWLFNLRGSDIDYNPLFFAYALVPKSGNPMLYLRDRENRLPNINNHLMCDVNGACNNTTLCTEVLPYGNVFADVATQATSASKVWMSDQSSFKIYSQVMPSKIVSDRSPIQLLRAIKNSIERDGMRNCHIRDSAAIIEFVAKLEAEVKAKKDWDEMKVSADLETYRRKQEYNEGLSFETIAGFGLNGAVIHYSPSNATNLKVTTDNLLLLDSGGQYRDGTTDITRTFHFGTPTSFQKEAYTRVLMGAINLAMIKWPANVTLGASLDAVARAPLWAVGLDYRHGTGHGVGMFLSVHEGPGRINIGYRPSAKESPIYEGMFFSDEPGYYEDGQFGVRLETTVMARKANTAHHFNGDYLEFEPIALVPFEPNLIDTRLMNSYQVTWLNAYHKICEEKVGEFLKKQNLQAAYDWLKKRTAAIEDSPPSAAYQTKPMLYINMVAVFTMAILYKLANNLS